MKYSLLVAMREFGEHVKTKGFWIGILMFPVLLAAGILVPQWLEKHARSTRNFCVIDPSGEYTKLVDKAVESHYKRRNNEANLAWLAKRMKDAETPAFEPLKPFFRRVEAPTEALGKDAEETRRNLRPWLRGDEKILVDGEEDELFALVVLPESGAKLDRDVEYWCTNLADSELSDVLEGGFRDWLKDREYERKGIDKGENERIAKIQVNFDRKDPKKAEGEEKVGKEEEIRQWAPVGFVYLLFVAIMTVAQMLLSSTVEEKTSRIIEVLLSSVTPWELMFGKLLGVALVGVTLLVAWLGSAYLVTGHFSGGNETADAILKVLIDPKLVLPFVLYFLLGYVLYASIILAMGSTCSSLKDAQNFMGPVTMVLMIPILTMVFIARDPNSTLATVMSWIPIFTPFIMMNRMAGSPPMIEVVGTFALLIAAVIGTVWIAGRIFQNGILRTGQAPKFLEFLRLIRRV